MNLEASTPYPLPELESGNGIFRGGQLQVEHGRTVRRDETPFGYRYLQLTLQNVDRRDVEALPHPVSIARELLRRNLVCFPDAEYGYECIARNGETSWRARGVVCTGLALRDDYRGVRDLEEKRDEVAQSFARGLLDEVGRSRADFRLASRPILQKLTGLRESDYLPEREWQVDVVFAQWRSAAGAAGLTPVEICGDLSRLSVSFNAVDRHRGFRMTDLF